MATATKHTTGRRNLDVAATGCRLGFLALGTLLGGVSTVGTSTWAGSPSTEATTTATSSLALAQPAATFTVTTQADVVDPGDGQLSLREAVGRANATASLDAILFKSPLEGQTLVLTGGQLTVSDNLIIDGDRNDDGIEVILSGGNISRVLNIAGSGTAVNLRDLTIIEGRALNQAGGAILLGGGSLAMTETIISDSATYSSVGAGDMKGGGIYIASGSNLLLTRSTISNCGSARGVAGTQRGAGGGIFAGSNSRVHLLDSVILDNRVHGYGEGGGIATGADVTLTVRNSLLANNRAGVYYDGGAISTKFGSSLMMEGTTLRGNNGDYGGALSLEGTTATIARSTISGNSAYSGAGIRAQDTRLTLTDSTVAGNFTDVTELSGGFARGGGIFALSSEVSIRNTTITSNSAFGKYGARGLGGGVYSSSTFPSKLDIANSIVAGNAVAGAAGSRDPDIFGTITASNGHNVFGTDVAGNIAGDRERVPASALFAAIDPGTGGGKLNARGVVPLKNSLTNPALSAADPITASSFGQLGTTKRPLPEGSLPDIGSIEIKQALSTSPTVNNDVLTGSSAANNLSGLAGNDYFKGLAGNDTLNGDDGSDVLDGGPGNDVLNGGPGVDIATFAGSTAVLVDLAATSATAKRGGETDTLTSIEGAIGSSKADTFTGDGQNNEFQGGLGKDVATGGSGQDLYAFRSVQDSPAGGGRDVIKDFVPRQDVIDVGNIDADSTIPGQQSFRWVGKATLIGAAQLGYYVSGGNTIVRASNDADAAAELEVQLTGVKVLTPADFRL